MMDFMELSRETTRLRNEDQYLKRDQKGQKVLQKKGCSRVTFSKQHTIFQTFFLFRQSFKEEFLIWHFLSKIFFALFKKSERALGNRRNKAVVTCFEKLCSGTTLKSLVPPPAAEKAF